MDVIWEIIERADGRYDILRSGEAVKSAVPDRWLEDELVRYGFCGLEYRNIRSQLAKSGKATLDLGPAEDRRQRRTRNYAGR